MSAGTRAPLDGSLRGFPAATVKLSADGVVQESNGRLEQLLGREVVGRPFAELLDSTSREKWRLLLERREKQPQGSLWELVFETEDTMELRCFAAVWGREDGDDLLWLIEYAGRHEARVAARGARGGEHGADRCAARSGQGACPHEPRAGRGGSGARPGGAGVVASSGTTRHLVIGADDAHAGRGRAPAPGGRVPGARRRHRSGVVAEGDRRRGALHRGRRW